MKFKLGRDISSRSKWAIAYIDKISSIIIYYIKNRTIPIITTDRTVRSEQLIVSKRAIGPSLLFDLFY